MNNRRKCLVVLKLFDQPPKGVRCLIVRTLSLISGNVDFTFSVFFTSTGAAAGDAAQLHFKSSSSTCATSGDAAQLHFKSYSTNGATAGDAAELHFNPCSTTFYHHRQSSSSLCYTTVAEPRLVAAGFLPAAALYSCRPTAGFFCSPDSPPPPPLARPPSRSPPSQPRSPTPSPPPTIQPVAPPPPPPTRVCSCSAHAAPACSHPAVVQSFTK